MTGFYDDLRVPFQHVSKYPNARRAAEIPETDITSDRRR